MEQEDNEVDVSSSLKITLAAPVQIIPQISQGKDIRVLQLIDLVREKPELWDRDADEMTDEALRTENVKLWESIAEITGFLGI
jgi:hypothetical protein